MSCTKKGFCLALEFQTNSLSSSGTEKLIITTNYIEYICMNVCMYIYTHTRNISNHQSKIRGSGILAPFWKSSPSLFSFFRKKKEKVNFFLKLLSYNLLLAHKKFIINFTLYHTDHLLSNMKNKIK